MHHCTLWEGDRQATFVLAATAQGLGHDIADININRSLIRRSRHRIRSEESQELRKTFQSTIALLEIHWDDKLLQDLTGKDMIDLLPVIIFGVKVNQLVRVAKITSSTGDAQTTAVFDLLKDWKPVDRTVSMCFDATASNNGIYNGDSILL